MSTGPSAAPAGPDVPDLLEKARETIKRSKAQNTRRAYEYDWEVFKRWCRAHAVTFLPASVDTVVLFLTHLAFNGRPRAGRRAGEQGYAIETIRRTRHTIAAAHLEAKLPNPTEDPNVVAFLDGLRRTVAEKTRRAKPLMPDHLAAIVKKLKRKHKARRFVLERALLLTGFAGGLRCSELAALQRGDVSVTDEGILFELVRQQGRRVEDVIPGTKHHAPGAASVVDFKTSADLVELGVCPVRALRTWFKIAKFPSREAPLIHHLGDGDPFHSLRVARSVKRAVELIGLDPKEYSGHSLRAGVATYLIWVRKENLFAVRDFLRHRSVSTLNVYVRKWDEVPGGGE